MKLIIECTEQTYSECKKISGLSITAFVIAHGIPYNPSGDLISREALKEQINATDFDCGDYYDNTEIIRERVCNVIGNVPPAPERQKGEWIFDKEFTEFGNPYGTYRCSVCGGHSSNQYSFCKDCGADMRGGTE